MMFEYAVPANINHLAFLIFDHHTKIKNLITIQVDFYFQVAKSVLIFYRKRKLVNSLLYGM
jgi:hypothetical protein